MQMKRTKLMMWLILLTLMVVPARQAGAQSGWQGGWPANYGGVMLQGFYWDSYQETNWEQLTAQADELSKYFSLIWIPNSGKTSSYYWNSQSTSMGYDPCFWLDHTSCWGTEEQLRSMISAYRERGTGIIEDVVINHKNGVSSWCDFADEEKGSYKLTWDNTNYTGICSNDEANYYGYPTGGAQDTGDNFDGFRDLDHTNALVQENVKTYLDFLLNDLGYAGFRYDMVKGYSPYYTKLYNESSHPTFSVGEFWDSKDGVYWWVNNTDKTSAAFDFGLKFSINGTFGQGNFDLSDKGMAADPNYSRYSVTFVDNHDTYRNNDRLGNNVLAANAFILAMPGTPCLFWPHWTLYKNELKKMVKARQAAGITNTSSITYQSNWGSNAHVIKVQGTQGEVLMICGYAENYDTSGYKAVSVGNGTNPNYAYFVSDNVDLGHLLATPQVSKPAGAYTPGMTTTLSASEAGATLVYTTDGSDPTPSNGTQVSGSTTLTFDETTTLKAGVLVDGDVLNIESFTYTLSDDAGRIYARSATGRAMYFYAYDGDYQPNGNWGEGNRVTTTTEINGETWYYYDYDLSAHPNLQLIVRDGNLGEYNRWPLEGNDVKISAYADKPYIYLRGNNDPYMYTGEEVEALSSQRIYARSESGSQMYFYTYGGKDGAELNGSWGNGNAINSTTTIDGQTWYYYDYDLIDHYNLRLIVRDASGNRYPGDGAEGILVSSLTSTPYVVLTAGTGSQEIGYYSEDDIVKEPYLIGPAVGIDFDQTPDAIALTWDAAGQCWSYTGPFTQNGELRLIVNQDYRRNWSEDSNSSDGSYYNHVAYHSDGDGTEAGCGGERIRFTGESGTYTLRFYPGDAPYYTMGRTLSLRNMTCIASPAGVKYGEIAPSTRTIDGTLYKSGASWADDAAWQKPEGVDVYVVSGLETNGESYKVTLSRLDGDIIPANTGVLLFSEQAPTTETDRYWTVEAVGAADAHASYSGTNLLAPVVTPTFIPGTETDASGDVTRRNFIFGFYCLEADSDTPPAVGEYSYQLGFWRSSLPADANPQTNLSSAHMAYLPLTPGQYGDSQYGAFDVPGSPTSSPFIHFSFDGEENGIGPIRSAASADGLYYTIEGVGLPRPMQKGLYIHNGKKVVVR